MSDTQPTPAGRSTKETAKLAAGAALLVLLVLFVVANTDKTRISFLVTDVDLPLIVVLVATAVFGGLIAELLRHLRNRR
jgi:uncharacterized integral membrane protein